MKKALLSVWGIVFIICFASCGKENVKPNYEKKASSSQSSSSQEAPASSTPGSGCHQSPPPGCPHAPANPVNPTNSGY